MNAPVTKAELEQFNGIEATQYECTQAINKHVAAFEADDLWEIVSENFTEINAALKNGDLLEVGRIIQKHRKAVIASGASFAVYGRGGVITADEVTA